MHKLLLATSLLLPASLFAHQPDGGGEQQNPTQDAAGASVSADLTPTASVTTEHRLTIPPILTVGNTGDRVREVQATLNERLRGKSVAIPPGFYVDDDKSAEVDSELKLTTAKRKILKQKDNQVIVNLKSEWDYVGDVGDDGGVKYVTFPEEHKEPVLKVDGVYGQQTFAAVLFFQQAEGLVPTGEVDAVTLDHLEPMIPPNVLLGTIMRWVSSIGIGADKTLGSRPDEEKGGFVLKLVTSIVMTTLILLVSVVVLQIGRMIAGSTRLLSRWLFTPQSSPWFTTLKEQQFFTHIAHFAPALFIYFAASAFPAPTEDPNADAYLNTFQHWHVVVSRIGLAYMGVAFALVAYSFVVTIEKLYTSEDDVGNPIKGIVAAGKRVVVFTGILLVCAGLAGKNPMYFIGGLGALMAIIILVFRDTLLGLVASVQIVANKTVQVGDWIEFPSQGIDGTVESISLSTIKVRNFDKTISSLPTFSVMSDSFKNWRGMIESGGRRIKRAVYIDMNTVQPCDREMLQRFGENPLIREYVAAKREELRQHLSAGEIRRRWLTNVGTYRVYVEAYLRNHPLIRDDMTLLVRQLPPGREGLPLEIYAFTTETSLTTYEQVQADIFDHVISVLPEFDLRIFQDPSEFNYEQTSALYEHRVRPSVVLATILDVDPAVLAKLDELVAEKNAYVAENPRRSVERAVEEVRNAVHEVGLGDKLAVNVDERKISLSAR